MAGQKKKISRKACFLPHSARRQLARAHRLFNWSTRTLFNLASALLAEWPGHLIWSHGQVKKQSKAHKRID